MESCYLCPRSCGTDRKNVFGFCKADGNVRIAKVMLHHWEEPCICYGAGSGAVFFSSCQLRCVFCQNHEISRKQCGKVLNKDELCELFFSLQEQGACNVNLVSPTPHLHTVIPALEDAKKKGLTIPVLMNSGGYESVETLKRLEGLVDIYMPDFKFFDPQLSSRYAKAADYAEIASKALLEMKRQIPKLIWEGERLKKGILVRHLILPGQSKDSVSILKHLVDLFPEKEIVLSLLRQYTPVGDLEEFPELKRRITALEYNRVEKKAEELSFPCVFTQEKESANEKFIPDFNKIIDIFPREC